MIRLVVYPIVMVIGVVTGVCFSQFHEFESGIIAAITTLAIFGVIK